MKENTKICIDFDGVINSYDTPFSGPTDLPDKPVPGAIEFLTELTDNFHVSLYTTRMLQGVAEAAISNWLLRNGLPFSALEKIAFTCVKRSADVYIDDRAYRFEGTFPSMDELKHLKPWNRQETRLLASNQAVVNLAKLYLADGEVRNLLDRKLDGANCGCSPKGMPHSEKCKGWYPGNPTYEEMK